MPHLLLSSCLFLHHLFQFTSNIMTYYVFQLDSPWCLFSLSVSYNAVCRFSIRAEELAPNVWQSVNGKQGEPDEKRDGLDFWWKFSGYLPFFCNIFIKISICSLWICERFVMMVWLLYNHCTIFFSIGKLKVSAHSSVQGQSKKWANAMFPWWIATCANNIYNACTMWRCIVFLGARLYPSVIKMKQKSKLFPKGCNICLYSIRSPLRLLRCSVHSAKKYIKTSAQRQLTASQPEWLHKCLFLSFAVDCCWLQGWVCE